MRMRARREAERTEDALLNALHADHAGALLGYLTRLTGDPQRAEDLVQETLLRAWRHADTLAGESSSLRSWLFTVAHNLAVDGHRARTAEPYGSEHIEREADIDQLDRALDAWQITEALATLSLEHRRALLETYFHGRSVAEAAVVLGVPPGTVKSRTYYALRALRLALEERGVGG